MRRALLHGNAEERQPDKATADCNADAGDADRRPERQVAERSRFSGELIIAVVRPEHYGAIQLPSCRKRVLLPEVAVDTLPRGVK